MEHQMIQTTEQMLCAFNKALNDSLKWDPKKAHLTNSLRSALFLSRSCEQLDGFIDGKGNYIRVVDDREKPRESGEWLLDGIWTKTHQPDCSEAEKPHEIAVAVCCALECESQTGEKQFFEDFSKLLVVSSPLKIFLAGLNQRTKVGANDYIEKRLKMIQELLEKPSVKQTESDWYIAFWPSPKIDGESKTLWDQLDKYCHLKEIRLFYRCKGKEGGFEEYPKNG